MLKFVNDQSRDKSSLYTAFTALLLCDMLYYKALYLSC